MSLDAHDVALPACFDWTPGWLPALHYQNVMAALVEELEWEQPVIQIYGKSVAVPRLTAWVGDPGREYSYSGIGNHAQPWTAELSDLRGMLEARTGARFNSCLANYYRDGSDSVSWHADDEPELGDEPVIASVSMGATRRFKIRSDSEYPKRDTWDLDLAHGSLLVMRGESQDDYQHSVPKTARPVGPRVNLTFRVIR